jgi:predicted CXXCH cytochrome family protein
MKILAVGSDSFVEWTMRKWVWLIAILFFGRVPLVAQDIDSNPLIQKRSISSIADQITDPSERAAFLQLFPQAPAALMLGRAEAFLARFPQSSFLAQAYEVAARASFDLQNYEPGLNYARRSLSLLPENPLLLVPVADVEAHRHLNDAAIMHAEEALQDLDSFASPSTVREEDWPDVKRRLQASANFSKGRALLQQALELQPGEKRTQLLRSSEASLLHAQYLNSADIEITYTLGLAQLAAGEALPAAGNFAAIYRDGGEVAPRALENLRAIYKLLYPRSDLPFETFVQQAQDRRTNALQKSSEGSNDRTPSVQSGSAYVGSESCRGCHSDIYKQWSQSGMAKMFRPYSPENVIGDFKTNNRFYLGDEVDYRGDKVEITRGGKRALFARMVIRSNRHCFDILQSDGKWHTYPVDYTIGSKFEQAYATKLPNGEIHVFPIQYNVLQKQWVNFWKVIDGPGSERADPQTWERLDSSTSYQAICAVCHTSQLKNVKGVGFDVNHLEFKEPGINCEMCHGPSADHVLETTVSDYQPKPPDVPPVNFHGIDNRKSVAICAQCHMQSAIRKPGTSGELNYFSDGYFFGDMVRQPFGEFSRKGFYKDGRFRQTTFIVEALERSQCYKKAAVSCGTCHDPHTHDAAGNPTSLKFRDQPDLMCTGCHTQFRDSPRAAQHSHHSPQSEGSRCVSCHMPRVMDALLFRARYHQMDDIPNAEMTKRFGQEESPNACLLCHSKKDADWGQQQLSAWESVVVKQK